MFSINSDKSEARKGSPIAAPVFSDEDAAEDYATRKRAHVGRGGSSVRVYPRNVKADNLVIPVWVVVVRAPKDSK